MNDSNDSLTSVLERIKQELRDEALGNQIKNVRYKLILDSSGIIQELKLCSLEDEVFINILKSRGYQVSKNF